MTEAEHICVTRHAHPHYPHIQNIKQKQKKNRETHLWSANISTLTCFNISAVFLLYIYTKKLHLLETNSPLTHTHTVLFLEHLPLVSPTAAWH